ncbi:MAG TPA: hypothetical protein VJ821_01145 [Anaerolineales bacterium]|nr:hypothetical protein [Anaerolineales bacterium]
MRTDIQTHPLWKGSGVREESAWEIFSSLQQASGRSLLTQHGLVNELYLLGYMLVLGSGTRIFREHRSSHLRLSNTQTFATGVVAFQDQPDRKE